MSAASDRVHILDAADTYGVPLPAYLTEAQSLLIAATSYKQEVAAVVEPDLSTVTAETIKETIDAVLAHGGHAERLRLACRVEANADSAVNTALMRFKHTLMTALAEPFDNAAGKFTAAHRAHKRQDAKVIATLADLTRIRDLLAGRVGDGLPSPSFDLPTRLATFPDREAIVRRFKLRTEGLERGSQQWFEALLDIPGCALKWQTPAEQAAHVNSIPPGGDSTLRHNTGGDAA